MVLDISLWKFLRASSGAVCKALGMGETERRNGALGFASGKDMEMLEVRRMLASEQALGLEGVTPVVSVVKSKNTGERDEDNNDKGRWTISRQKPWTQALTVKYVLSGTATAGEDYQTLSGEVVIPAGKKKVDVHLLVIDDLLAEGSETVVLTLVEDDGYTISNKPGRAAGTVTIKDNESVVSIARKKNASEVDGGGKGKGVFTVTRSGGTTAQALVVKYAVSGTATEGEDYQTLSGEVVIPAGKKKVDVNLLVIDDLLAEGSETVVLTLVEDDGYTISNKPGKATATVKIADNWPVVSIAKKRDASERNGNNRGKGVFTITRHGGSTAQALTVNYIVDGTAIGGSDYVELLGSVVIPAGKRSVDVTVRAMDDLLSEGNETVILVLEEDDHYTIDARQSLAVVKIKDNEDSPEEFEEEGLPLLPENGWGWRRTKGGRLILWP